MLGPKVNLSAILVHNKLWESQANSYALSAAFFLADLTECFEELLLLFLFDAYATVYHWYMHILFLKPNHNGYVTLSISEFDGVQKQI